MNEPTNPGTTTLTSGWVVAASGTSPAALYLASLNAGSRPTQAAALRAIVRFLLSKANEQWPGQLGGKSPGTFAWHKLDAVALGAIYEWIRTGFAPATGRRYVAALKGVLKASWRIGHLDSDQLARLVDSFPPLRGKKVRPGRALTPGEIEVLTREAGLFERALILVMVGAGLRRHEAAGLKYGDVVFCSPEAETIELLVTGKGNKERSVFLGGRCAAALAAWMADNPPASDQDLVFGLTVSGLAKRLHSILSRVRATSHDLRRTYASAALERGVDLGTVQQVLGHEDPRTTAGYDRRNETAAKRAASEVNSWLNG